MNISEHFSLSEFAQRAWSKGPAMPYPSIWTESRLIPLCTQLEVIRAAAGGRPVTIVSGYRSPLFNKALPGAARKSQHMEGRAADIRIGDLDPGNVHDMILKLCREGLLPLVRGLGLYRGFTHVDIRPAPRLVRWTGSVKRKPE